MEFATCGGYGIEIAEWKKVIEKSGEVVSCEIVLKILQEWEVSIRAWDSAHGHWYEERGK